MTRKSLPGFTLRESSPGVLDKFCDYIFNAEEYCLGSRCRISQDSSRRLAIRRQLASGAEKESHALAPILDIACTQTGSRPRANLLRGLKELKFKRRNKIVSIAFAWRPKRNPGIYDASSGPAGNGSQTESHRQKQSNACVNLHRKSDQSFMVRGRRLATDFNRRARLMARYITETFGHGGIFRGWQFCVRDEA